MHYSNIYLLNSQFKATVVILLSETQHIYSLFLLHTKIRFRTGIAVTIYSYFTNVCWGNISLKHPNWSLQYLNYQFTLLRHSGMVYNQHYWKIWPFTNVLQIICVWKWERRTPGGEKKKLNLSPFPKWCSPRARNGEETVKVTWSTYEKCVRKENKRMPDKNILERLIWSDKISLSSMIN